MSEAVLIRYLTTLIIQMELSFRILVHVELGGKGNAANKKRTNPRSLGELSVKTIV
jgi:hypothetical protein